MKRFIALSIEEVKHVAHWLAKETMEWKEPIPDFETRLPGRLESCLHTPFMTFGKRVAYKGLQGKSAMLFYLMIKNHPFQNGNKRIAVTTLLYFLYKNGKWLKMDNQRLYNFAKFVAESDPQVKDSMVKLIEEFIAKNISDLSKRTSAE